MKLLCIGDSNTYGYDPRAALGARYPEEVRWTGRLKDHTVINCGINGMTVPRGDTVFTDLVRKEDPGLVIVMLGTNDLLEGNGAVLTAERMERFISRLLETGRPVLLVAPPHFQYGAWVEGEAQIEESRKLGKLYREAAGRISCLYADAGEWDIEAVFDGVHFSPAGHAKFARKLEEILKQL